MATDESRLSGSARIDRQHWMSLLAAAKPERLGALFPPDRFPPFIYLRQPETGLVMLRGRIGGTGSAFNIGETTVTRCAIRLADGTVGQAFVMGRSHGHALAAALCDAMLQSAATDVAQTVIAPLAKEREAHERGLARKNAATKVDFFTMVRGEDG